jgi:hypothetical protein
MREVWTLLVKRKMFHRTCSQYCLKFVSPIPLMLIPIVRMSTKLSQTSLNCEVAKWMHSPCHRKLVGQRETVCTLGIEQYIVRPRRVERNQSSKCNRLNKALAPIDLLKTANIVNRLGYRSDPERFAASGAPSSFEKFNTPGADMVCGFCN